MAIGAIWYPPVERQAYEAIRDKVLQAGFDKGMQFHAAGEAEGQWRVFEVWDSRDAMERYVREDLGPAADEASGGQAEIPQPELVFDIHYQAP
jgi:quinol monooxygenase YgiN